MKKPAALYASSSFWPPWERRRDYGVSNQGPRGSANQPPATKLSSYPRLPPAHHDKSKDSFECDPYISLYTLVFKGNAARAPSEQRMVIGSKTAFILERVGIEQLPNIVSLYIHTYIQASQEGPGPRMVGSNRQHFQVSKPPLHGRLL